MVEFFGKCYHNNNDGKYIYDNKKREIVEMICHDLHVIIFCCCEEGSSSTWNYIFFGTVSGILIEHIQTATIRKEEFIYFLISIPFDFKNASPSNYNLLFCIYVFLCWKFLNSEKFLYFSHHFLEPIYKMHSTIFLLTLPQHPSWLFILLPFIPFIIYAYYSAWLLHFFVEIKNGAAMKKK